MVLQKDHQEYTSPQRIISGGGSIAHLGNVLTSLGCKNPLIVTDAYQFQGGRIAEVVARLQAEGISSSVYHRVSPDPTVSCVQAGLEVLKGRACDSVVAIGGGSPIDAAKAMSVLATNDGALAQYAGYHLIPKRGLPMVAVPTTSGTGSEATRVAVITDEQRQVKMMLLDNALLPDAAIVDYRLAMTMPAELTAYVGVDTLTHGLEAYVSAKANAMSDPLAISCMSLVNQHLLSAFNHPDDEIAREGMAVAACHGGMAFSNSSVCLVHGMSRPLGAVYHLAHGLSNAVLLPSITRYSLPGRLQRYASVARLFGVASPDAPDHVAAEALVEALESLNRRLGIPRLRDCVNVPYPAFAASVPKMSVDALASGSPDRNPVVPGAAEIERLYLACW